MLGRKHIKQAIQEISKRDPDTGYALDQMLAMGRIGPLGPEKHDPLDENFYFEFHGRAVAVRRGSFFHSGSVPIEQQLLIQYGEMAYSHQSYGHSDGSDFHSAALRARAAGLNLVVDHEIAYALSRIPSTTPAPDSEIIGLLRRMADGDSDIALPPKALMEEGEAPPMFLGMVGEEQQAVFTRFPFTRTALIQVADINLEFFCVRTVLDILIRGNGLRLFAAIVGESIAGIMHLVIKRRFLYQALEINTISTVSAVKNPETATYAQRIKGVGAFLVAGAYFLWKTVYPKAGELVLDSEIGARRFYDRIGFEPRGLSEFVFHKPRGRLIPCLIIMAVQFHDLPPKVIKLIRRLIQNQAALLAQNAKKAGGPDARRRALTALRFCLAPNSPPIFFNAAVQELIKRQDQIPEAAGLIVAADKTLL